MPTSSGYKGILARPMTPESLSESNVALRFAALADHYGVAHDDPELDHKLMVALARAHVPGFRVRRRKPRGRKPRYSLVALTVLDFLDRRAKASARISSKAIISRMSSREKFYQDIGYGGEKGAEALEKLIRRNVGIELDYDRLIADLKKRRLPRKSGTE